MKLTQKAEKARERYFGGSHPLEAKHPEFVESYLNFVFDDLAGQVALDEKERVLICLCAALATNSEAAYSRLIRVALRIGVSPVLIEEALYQSVLWIGAGAAEKYFYILDAAFEEANVALPSAPRSTSNFSTRLKNGLETHKEAFPNMGAFISGESERARKFWKILVANMSGDYFSRKGMSIDIGEYISFIYIISTTCDDSQLRVALAALTRFKCISAKLLDTVLVAIPFIGYSRAMSAYKLVQSVLYGEK